MVMQNDTGCEARLCRADKHRARLLVREPIQASALGRSALCGSAIDKAIAGLEHFIIRPSSWLHQARGFPMYQEDAKSSRKRAVFWGADVGRYPGQCLGVAGLGMQRDTTLTVRGWSDT